MKKITLAMIFCLLLTACESKSIGIIGGADGPTSILVGENSEIVKGQFGEQYEKKPLRMFRLDGDLYYDSGISGELTPRCGIFDGQLIKTAEIGEIPQKSGESNFEVDGYRNVTKIAKEVNINGEWVIFKKYDSFGKSIEEYNYGFYMKGHLNNAAVDSEIIVLSDNVDVIFNDVYEPLLSSQYHSGVKCRTTHNSVNSDNWGLSLSAENVTNTGMTIRFEQFGGNVQGELQTGTWFKIERSTDDGWQELSINPLINYVWNAMAYQIKRNDITELCVEWKWLYGELETGYYRLSKEVMDLKKAGKLDKEIYPVYFTVEE